MVVGVTGVGASIGSLATGFPPFPFSKPLNVAIVSVETTNLLSTFLGKCPVTPSWNTQVAPNRPLKGPPTVDGCEIYFAPKKPNCIQQTLWFQPWLPLFDSPVNNQPWPRFPGKSPLVFAHGSLSWCAIDPPRPEPQATEARRMYQVLQGQEPVEAFAVHFFRKARLGAPGSALSGIRDRVGLVDPSIHGSEPSGSIGCPFFSPGELVCSG